MRYQCSVWQHDRAEKTRHNFNWQERAKEITIDVVVPADVRVGEKEREEVEKHQDLKTEIARLWKLKMVEFVPVVIGALTSFTKEFDGWIEKPGIKTMLEGCQRLHYSGLRGYGKMCWRCK